MVPYVKIPFSTKGLQIGSATVLASAILDQEQTEFPPNTLYAEGWTLVLFNLLYVGPVIYACVQPSYMAKSLFRNVLDTCSMVVIHSGLYNVVHRIMHRVRAFRPIHNIHHQFKDVVVSSSANAVSVQEFLWAYMMPFVVGVHLIHPTESALFASTSIVSAFNLLVHSPHLSTQKWISWFVSPSEHLTHHKTRTPSYSAPTFHWGRIWSKVTHAK